MNKRDQVFIFIAVLAVIAIAGCFEVGKSNGRASQELASEKACNQRINEALIEQAEMELKEEVMKDESWR